MRLPGGDSPQASNGEGWTRRRFLSTSGFAVAGLLALPRLPLGLGSAVATGSQRPLDPLGTLRAYCATLVPGPADDPRGTPGAVEAGALQELQAEVGPVLPLLVADLEAHALATHGRLFADLDYPARERILVTAFADPVRQTPYLITLAIGAGCYYGDFRNRVGGRQLGFPGPSSGYLDRYSDHTGYGQPQREAIPA